MAKNIPTLEIRAYEVWYDETNQKYFLDMASSYGYEPKAVPTFFIGDKHFEGFSDVFAEELQKEVEACVTNGCADHGEGVITPEGLAAGPIGFEAIIQKQLAENGNGGTSEVVQPTAIPEPVETAPVDNAASELIDVPLLGRINLAEKSIWLSTAIIAFVDGFNPCSLWVLSMLLALTLHTGSRRKILIIGLVFLTITAAVYGLFITGLFTMFTVINFVGWIQVVVALVALFFGLVNIKDYFWYKEGLSFTISDQQKPGIFSRMRKLMDASQSFGGLVTGTVVLAAGVSLVEFSCTAGFPVLWTNLLVSQQTSAGLFALLLLVYLVIYQLDELVIFFTAVYTLKASRVEEKQGRILKLIGGVLMLALAGVMLVDPALMNNISSTIVIFGIAFLVTVLILVIHRVILPRFGIQIGTESLVARCKEKTTNSQASVNFTRRDWCGLITGSDSPSRCCFTCLKNWSAVDPSSRR